MDSARYSLLRRAYLKPWQTNSIGQRKRLDIKTAPYLKPLPKPEPRGKRHRMAERRKREQAAENQTEENNNREEPKSEEHQAPEDKAQEQRNQEKKEEKKPQKFFIEKEILQNRAAAQYKITKTKNMIRSQNPKDPLNIQWQMNYRLHKQKLANARPVINSFATDRVPGLGPKNFQLEYINRHYAIKTRIIAARARQRVNNTRNLIKDNDMFHDRLQKIYTGKSNIDNKLSQYVLRLKGAKERTRMLKRKTILKENVKIVHRIKNVKPAIKTWEQIVEYKRNKQNAFRISKFPHFWKLDRPLSVSEKIELTTTCRDPNPRVFFDFKAGDKFLGRVIIQLRGRRIPKSCENFRSLCVGDRGIGYRGIKVTRISPGFFWEMGDVSNTWAGKLGQVTAFGDLFKQESFEIPHDRAGIVTMRAYEGGKVGSVFLITDTAISAYNGKHQAIGYVEKGMHVLKSMEKYWNDGKWDVPIWCSSSGQLYGDRSLGWLEIKCHDDVIPWKCPAELPVYEDEDFPDWNSERGSDADEDITKDNPFFQNAVKRTPSEEELFYNGDPALFYPNYRRSSSSSSESVQVAGRGSPVTPLSSSSARQASSTSAIKLVRPCTRRLLSVNTIFSARESRKFPASSSSDTEKEDKTENSANPIQLEEMTTEQKEEEETMDRLDSSPKIRLPTGHGDERNIEPCESKEEVPQDDGEFYNHPQFEEGIEVPEDHTESDSERSEKGIFEVSEPEYPTDTTDDTDEYEEKVWDLDDLDDETETEEQVDVFDEVEDETDESEDHVNDYDEVEDESNGNGEQVEEFDEVTDETDESEEKVEEVDEYSDHFEEDDSDCDDKVEEQVAVCSQQAKDQVCDEESDITISDGSNDENTDNDYYSSDYEEAD